MRKKFRRSVSQAARKSPQFGGWAVILLLLVLILHHFELILSETFIKALLASMMLAFIGLGLAIKGFCDLWSRGDKGGRASLKGLILSLITLVPLSFLGVFWLIFPSLYDISSDLDNPPSYPTSVRPIKALSPLLITKKADAQREAWPNLRGRRYEISPDRILNAVEAVMVAQDWKKQAQFQDNENNPIFVKTIARVPLLGFASDVLIRIRDEDEATWVDMRVTARDFSHDFGFGAYSISHFMQALDREVLLSALERVEED